MEAIVIIDDDPIARGLIHKALTKIPNVKLHVYKNGEECYSKYKGEPSILITDYHLMDGNGVGINGIDFSHLYPKTKKILISGNNLSDINFDRNRFEGVVIKGGEYTTQLTELVKSILNGRNNRFEKPFKSLFTKYRKLNILFWVLLTLIVSLSISYLLI